VHDCCVEPFLVPSQLLIVEVLRRPLEFTQYTSAEFRELLAEHGIVQSLARPGQCWDNAVAESFFSTLKEELLYRGVWPTRAAARRAIFEYVEVFYNHQRMHSALDYLTPVAYEARQRDLNEAQAA
jgi:transposase InsO family protein